mgnify:FL=1
MHEKLRNNRGLRDTRPPEPPCVLRLPQHPLQRNLMPLHSRPNAVFSAQFVTGSLSQLAQSISCSLRTISLAGLLPASIPFHFSLS